MPNTQTTPELQTLALDSYTASLAEQARQRKAQDDRERETRRDYLIYALRMVFHASEADARAAVIDPEAHYAVYQGAYIVDTTYRRRSYEPGVMDTVDVKCTVWIDRHDGRGATAEQVRSITQLGELLSAGGTLVDRRTYVRLERDPDGEAEGVLLTREEADKRLAAPGSDWYEVEHE